MNTGLLIPDPILDDRSEERRIAEAGLRMIGDNLSIEDAQFGQRVFRELELLIAELIADLPDGLLPEITSLRPGEPQYVIISELTRLCTEMIYRLNQVPNKNRIAFLRLLNTEIIPDKSATTTLRFTKLAEFLNQDVVIPAGTIVTTANRQRAVSLDEELLVSAGNASGDVAATSTVAGDVGRVTVGKFVLAQTAIGGLQSVSNITDLSGGRNAETVAQAVVRARESMRIGLHLGSADDYRTHITLAILLGRGRVTPFEFRRGNFSKGGLGYTLLVIQGEDGLAPSTTILDQISAVIAQRHVVGTSVVARGPNFRRFSLVVGVSISDSEQPNILKEQARAALIARFNPLHFAYGPDLKRSIDLSDIVGAIESASQEGISVVNTSGTLAITIKLEGDTEVHTSVPLNESELPLLEDVELIAA